MKILLLFLLTSAILVNALDFKTKSGKVYRDAGIGKMSSTGVEILLESGTEVLPLNEISNDLLNKLGAKRKVRLERLIKEYNERPPEVLQKEKKAQEKQNAQFEQALARGDRFYRDLQEWLKVYGITQSPTDDARKFSDMAKAFSREYKNAETDKEKVDILVNFLKKVQKEGFTDQLTLKPPQTPIRNDIQGSNPTGQPYQPPRGARYYKKDGRTTPVQFNLR